MSRQFKLTESERSPIILSALWKQKVNLERDLRILESNKQLVVNRITLNQKIMIKAFKKKLYQAKLSHARIFGDREAEKTLRNRSDYMSNHLHTNLAIDPEDEEILKKIWNRSQRIPEIESKESKRLAKRSAFTKSAPAGRKNTITPKCRNNKGTEILPSRPQTVCVINPELHKKHSLYVCTGQKVQSENEQNDQEPSPERTIGEPKNDDSLSVERQVSVTGPEDPRTSQTESTVALPSGPCTECKQTDTVPEDIKGEDNDPVSSPEEKRKAVSAKSCSRSEDVATTNVFEQDNRHDRLLEIQRRRIQSANYEHRVKELCNTLTPYIIPKDYVVQDYYQYCMVEDSRAMRGRKVSGYRTPVVQEAEIRKSIGNLDIRSMTLKRLSYNFDRTETRTNRFNIS